MGPSPGRPRPWHCRGWEEKVAAVAQSARVSATRDGLPVGQSQLRAPDQALGERTNKCSRARIPALGVTTGGDSGRPRSRPHPLPGSSRRSEPPPQRPQPQGHSLRLARNFFALGSRSWTLGLPARPFPRFLLEPRSGLGASSSPPRVPPSLSSLFGEGLSTLRGVSEGRQRRACLSISPSPGYNFQAKLPPG